MAMSLNAKESAKQLQTLIDRQKGMFDNEKYRGAASNDNLDELVKIRPNESMDKIITKHDTEKVNLADKYRSMGVDQRNN